MRAFCCCLLSRIHACFVHSLNPSGLLQRCIAALKKEVPEVMVITDVALDPYSSDGHDGVVRLIPPFSCWSLRLSIVAQLTDEGIIDNDLTVPILAKMAVAQAQAGNP